MNDDIAASRQRISRRRALAIGGSVGLGGLLAACGVGSTSSSSSANSATGSTVSPGSAAPSATAVATNTDAIALLDEANTCTLTQEETQGPYWFNVDSIRSDIREGRPGTALNLALRVQDMAKCAVGGAVAPVANSVVEIWHCDAGGAYSGFENGAGGGRPGGTSGGTSNGTYSKGDNEAAPTDDGTYLRGAQVADANGIVQFTTIYPGWYQGRATHIHLKVHIDRSSVLTSQLYFDEKINSAVYATSPYSKRSGNRTTNSADSLFNQSGLVSISQQPASYLAVINLSINR